ncbi:MAG: hypothetical protein EXR76_18770 [Myxococcales bacterium]|nr:hypothetical protein [Myxococcales bacterium]
MSGVEEDAVEVIERHASEDLGGVMGLPALVSGVSQEVSVAVLDAGSAVCRVMQVEALLGAAGVVGRARCVVGFDRVARPVVRADDVHLGREAEGEAALQDAEVRVDGPVSVAHVSRDLLRAVGPLGDEADLAVAEPVVKLVVEDVHPRGRIGQRPSIPSGGRRLLPLRLSGQAGPRRLRIPHCRVLGLPDRQSTREGGVWGLNPCLPSIRRAAAIQARDLKRSPGRPLRGPPPAIRAPSCRDPPTVWLNLFIYSLQSMSSPLRLG